MGNNDEKMWAMLCHLSAAAGYVTGIGFWIGPLIVWLMKKDQMPLVDINGKESLNFQLSILLYMFISGILSLVLIGIVLLAAVGIFQLVEIVMATIKVNNGEEYRYPLTIRFIK